MDILTQAGAVAYRGKYPDIEVLIIRARRNPQDWIFPKGHVDSGEDARDAAVRELEEEGAVTGEIVGEAGVNYFLLDNQSVEVAYYIVEAGDEIPPEEDRERRWVSLAEARRLLTYEETRKLLDAVEKHFTKS